jgi:hypothetical protein
MILKTSALGRQTITLTVEQPQGVKAVGVELPAVDALLMLTVRPDVG